VTGKNYYVVFNSIPGAAGSFAGNLKANATSNSSTVIEVKLEKRRYPKKVLIF